MTSGGSVMDLSKIMLGFDLPEGEAAALLFAVRNQFACAALPWVQAHCPDEDKGDIAREVFDMADAMVDEMMQR